MEARRAPATALSRQLSALSEYPRQPTKPFFPSLVKHFLNPDIRGCLQQTPPHVATLLERLTIGHWLLDRGPDVGAQETNPLYIAALTRHLGFARMLTYSEAGQHCRSNQYIQSPWCGSAACGTRKWSSKNRMIITGTRCGFQRAL